MNLISPALLLILMQCGSLLGQSSAPVTQPQTFHVRGTITDPIEAVVPGVKVTFQGEQLNKTVTTNDSGAYEVDLPLGDYAMTAQIPGFMRYRRPLFRMTAPANLTFDVALISAASCDVVVVNPTPENLAAAEKEFCIHQDVFPAPSKDGVQYQIYIRYGRMHPEKYPSEGRVFVAYNLFSLQSDSVTYDEKSRIIEASGNVVVADGSGITQRAVAMSFKMEDGQALQIR